VVWFERASLIITGDTNRCRISHGERLTYRVLSLVRKNCTSHLKVVLPMNHARNIEVVLHDLKNYASAISDSSYTYPRTRCCAYGIESSLQGVRDRPYANGWLGWAWYIRGGRRPQDQAKESPKCEHPGNAPGVFDRRTESCSVAATGFTQAAIALRRRTT
jgi:hypothetical protein